MGLAYLFPLTVATVLEDDAVCISDRSRLLTSNLNVHSRINYLRWQVFSIATVQLERESVRGIFICCSGVVVVGHMGSRL